jgi:hypothetical protein
MGFSLISRRFFPRKVTSGSIDKEIVVPLMLFYGKTLINIFSNKFEGPVVLVLNIDWNCNNTNICAQFRERTQIYLSF